MWWFPKGGEGGGMRESTRNVASLLLTLLTVIYFFIRFFRHLPRVWLDFAHFFFWSTFYCFPPNQVGIYDKRKLFSTLTNLIQKLSHANPRATSQIINVSFDPEKKIPTWTRRIRVNIFSKAPPITGTGWADCERLGLSCVWARRWAVG